MIFCGPVILIYNSTCLSMLSLPQNSVSATLKTALLVHCSSDFDILWGNIKRLKDFVDNPVYSSLSSELLSKPFFELDYHIPTILPQYNFLYLEWWFRRWRLKIYLSHSCCFPSPEICLPISLDSLCFILLKLRCGIKPFWVLSHVLWPQCRASRVVRLFKKNNFSTTFSLLCFPWHLGIPFKYEYTLF